jgi:hypothetical protein
LRSAVLLGEHLPEKPRTTKAVVRATSFFQALDEVTAEAWGEENGRPAVSTGGDELQFARAVSAMIDRHAGFEYMRSDGLGEAIRSKCPFGASQTPKGGSLRQPPFKSRVRSRAGADIKRRGLGQPPAA